MVAPASSRRFSSIPLPILSKQLAGCRRYLMAAAGARRAGARAAIRRWGLRRGGAIWAAEGRKLQLFAPAAAFRAGHLLARGAHQPLVGRVAILTNVFVDGHGT